MQDRNWLEHLFDESMNSDSQFTEKAAALMSLINANRALFHRMKVVAEQVHHRGFMSAGKRGVLMSLQQLGDQTVPQLARARPVSRQHIQTLVNKLLDEGLVEYIENPAHKRSRLVHLTRQGSATVKTMIQRELKVLADITLGIRTEELQLAVKVLHNVREYFAGSQWLGHLKANDGP